VVLELVLADVVDDGAVRVDDPDVQPTTRRSSAVTVAVARVLTGAQDRRSRPAERG
jgi:hypothetical protein